MPSVGTMPGQLLSQAPPSRFELCILQFIRTGRRSMLPGTGKHSLHCLSMTSKIWNRCHGRLASLTVTGGTGISLLQIYNDSLLSLMFEEWISKQMILTKFSLKPPATTITITCLSPLPSSVSVLLTLQVRVHKQKTFVFKLHKTYFSGNAEIHKLMFLTVYIFI